MTRLITWSLIILAFGLGMTWMIRSAQLNPRPLPESMKAPATAPAKPEPSLSEQAGTAARTAVDKAKEVGAQVTEQSNTLVNEVSEATKKAADKTNEVVGETAKQVSEAAKQAAEQAGKTVDQFVEGFNKPAEPAKP